MKMVTLFELNCITTFIVKYLLCCLGIKPEVRDWFRTFQVPRTCPRYGRTSRSWCRIPGRLLFVRRISYDRIRPNPDPDPWLALDNPPCREGQTRRKYRRRVWKKAKKKYLKVSSTIKNKRISSCPIFWVKIKSKLKCATQKVEKLTWGKWH